MDIRQIIIEVTALVNGVSIAEITNETIVDIQSQTGLSFSQEMGKRIPGGVFIGLDYRDKNKPVKHFIDLYGSLCKFASKGI